MVAVPPDSKSIAPGTVTNLNAYPQWGVKMSGTTSGTVKEATTAAEKQSDIDNGYDSWFSSDKAAKNFVSSETSVLNGNVPDPLTILGLPKLSNLRNFVIRAVKVIVGLALIVVGTVKLLHVESAVKDVAPIVGKAAMV